MIDAPYWAPAQCEGFLLDWDGVIAETKLDFSGLREKYFGGRRAMLLEEGALLPPELRGQYMKELQEIEMAGAERAVPVPGALELIAWLRKHKVPYCILSRNSMEVIRRGAETIGFELPELTWGRDNAPFVKPDPAALRAAATALGAAPEKCAYVGDFIYDLQGARRSAMRAILVQHEGTEWLNWADVSYPKLTELVEALVDPKPLVPWEYREISLKKGERWLTAAAELCFSLPSDPSPTSDCWLLRAASLGVGTFCVEGDKIFTPEDWKKNQSFDISLMGRSWAEAVRSLFAERYPLVRVTEEADNAMVAPKNSLDIMRFIERKKLF